MYKLMYNCTLLALFCFCSELVEISDTFFDADSDKFDEILDPLAAGCKCKVRTILDVIHGHFRYVLS